ncbi:uncharacterized protein CANTADRAFT_26024 [Suhomyces tanzawaensis NRRL Y-17324]|uniref:Uncharacterized protein n=1 Tax=Suhomyces tanzawaensis NRRL Y-17324 TaxID=984487 RepID=A0A1E4SHF5_9ASCO|nr:uncharacterized protein CANTADRAFT_26024 [Suhomyces tanzawaensis NRRL Y-17324]ODV78900.1 hypothetical protein CANTADRAFT_26024 [Suhomyces tanzawaensis NRRL Y-17324]
MIEIDTKIGSQTNISINDTNGCFNNKPLETMKKIMNLKKNNEAHSICPEDDFLCLNFAKNSTRRSSRRFVSTD